MAQVRVGFRWGRYRLASISLGLAADSHLDVVFACICTYLVRRVVPGILTGGEFVRECSTNVAILVRLASL